MVQLAVLVAGFIILLTSLVLAGIGSRKKDKSSQILKKVFVNPGQGYDLNEFRLPFSVDGESKGFLDVKAWAGKVDINLKRVPFVSSPEPNVGWAYSSVYNYHQCFFGSFSWSFYTCCSSFEWNVKFVLLSRGHECDVASVIYSGLNDRAFGYLEEFELAC